MAKKITITEKQARQFNFMLAGLKRICNDYATTEQLRKESKEEYGLDYEEALEMAYDNIQADACFFANRIREIKIPTPTNDNNNI